MPEIGSVIGPLLGALRRLIPKSKRREREQFENVYAPMQALFLTRHITTYSSSGAPYLRQRVRIARDFLNRRRHRWALRAIFDKQHREAAEVEFGGSFPLEQIHRIVKGNERYCDGMLLTLIARADRSRYEEPGDEVTADELALFRHIMKKHGTLSRKYVGK